jgi:hypothetical protein
MWQFDTPVENDPFIPIYIDDLPIQMVIFDSRAQIISYDIFGGSPE